MYQKRKKYFSDRVKAGYYKGKTVKRKAELRKKYLEKNDYNCKKCSWDTIPEILHIHHIDCDRENSKLENIIMLCPNCHYSRHYIEKTASWNPKMKKKYDTSNYNANWRT